MSCYGVVSSSSPPAGSSAEGFVGPCYLVSRYRLRLEHCEDHLFDGAGEDSAARFLYRVFGSQCRELVGALYYDSRQRLLGFAIHHIGTLSRASVEPRSFFATAFLVNAASMKLFHFHPSGSLEPSVEDRRFTRELEQCGKLLGVPVEEHLILGHRGQFARVK